MTRALRAVCWSVLGFDVLVWIGALMSPGDVGPIWFSWGIPTILGLFLVGRSDIWSDE